MANAPVDQNTQQAMIGVLNTDGKTITRVVASPTTSYLHVNDNTTGTNLADSNSYTDSNGRTTMFAVSSVDGKTLVALNVDSTGALLINSH